MSRAITCSPEAMVAPNTDLSYRDAVAVAMPLAGGTAPLTLAP